MQSVIGKSIASGRAIGTVLVVSALAATLTALLLPVHMFDNGTPVAASQGWDDDGGGTVNTAHGPLTALDRDFVRKVRAAGTWELPAGRQFQERSDKETIQTAGEHLIEGHTELDERSIEVGRTLGINLPNQPNEQQQLWLQQMSAAEGEEYERLAVNLLRRAHGKVFNLIALVRSQTRNSMVRSLATRVNAVVLDHITVLEDTGLVDFETLGENTPPSPPTTSGPVVGSAPVHGERSGTSS
jgi:predicted outer membrane protein